MRYTFIFMKMSDISYYLTVRNMLHTNSGKCATSSSTSSPKIHGQLPLVVRRKLGTVGANMTAWNISKKSYVRNMVSDQLR